MTLEQICRHEALEMRMHDLQQHNSHVWCWLVEMLRQWGEAHPIRVVE